MKLRRILVGLVLIAAMTGGLSYGWRWYTTPTLPHISLEGADRLTVEAVENARQEVATQPRSGKSWGKLAMVLSVNGYLEPALTCFSNAERFDGENPCWPYLHGVQLLTDSPHPKDGIPYMRKALTLARKPDQQAAIAFKLALAYIDEGQFDEALQPLELLAKIQPDDSRVHYGLGLLAAGRDDRIAAREHLSKIADNPLSRKRACLLLAALSEDDRESASKYRKILERFPPDLPWPDPFEGLMAGYKVNRFARIQQYLELDRQGRSEEAIALLRRFVSERPDEEVCHNLGIALFKKNEFKEAAEAFRAALSFNPQNGSNHYYLENPFCTRERNYCGRADPPRRWNCSAKPWRPRTKRLPSKPTSAMPSMSAALHTRALDRPKKQSSLFVKQKHFYPIRQASLSIWVKLWPNRASSARRKHNWKMRFD
jgi:tetratricopeptide (TPR) repeat protein